MTDQLKQRRSSVKTTRPAARNVVARERVFAALDAAMSVSCLLVCAPAGYGKSLSVASWLSDRGIDAAAWVNVGDVQDNSRSVWEGLIESLAQAAQPDDSLRAIGDAAQSSPAEVPARLARWIGGRDHDTVVVLDDLNGVTGRMVHEQLVEFIAAGVPKLHVVAITRHDPPWPTHRMRADGLLSDVREDILRFDTPETQVLFGQLDVDLGEGELAALVERTQGWAAGLRLAALGLRGTGDAESFIADFSGRSGYIADYLMNEVYAGLPRRWRTFLVTVGTVDEVCPELAIALGAGEDSEDILAELSQVNAFVHELGDHLGWYRLHPLLLDFVRSRVTDRTLQRGLHRRAARWYRDQDQPLAALRHAMAGRDWPLAADLVSVNVVSWTVRRAPADLLDTLAAVPSEVMLTHPGLALGKAAAQAMGGIPTGLADLIVSTRAELHRVEEEDRRRVAFVLDLIELGVKRWAGDLDGMLADCRGMPTDPHVLAATGIADWAALRILLLNNIGTAELWLGQAGLARTHLRDAATQSLGSKLVLPILNARAHLALLHWAAGELDAASTWGGEAVAGFAAEGIPSAAQSAAAYLALAGVAFDRDELDDARHWLDVAEDAVAEPCARVALALLRARVTLAGGAAYDAASILRVGLEQTPDALVPPPLRAAAARLTETIRARVAGCSASTGLDGDWGMAEPGSPRTMVEDYLDQAVAQSDQDAQIDALEKALVVASEPSLRQAFLARETELRELLAERIEKGSAQTEFALDLLSRMSAGRTRPTGTVGVFVPLSERETNVLRYLVSSLTTAEIADALYISVNTVKTHQRSIYQKLTARGRREAVARARELGLI